MSIGEKALINMLKFPHFSAFLNSHMTFVVLFAKVIGL